MHGRISRLVLVTPIVAALAMTVMASRPAASGGAETPALKSISSRLDGAVSTVLIEASEPVAYLTSQPDPLTVLVDLRNVNAAALDGKPIADMLTPVSAVGVESATAPDGAPVARVRVRLDREAKHRVRSSRNTILVEVDRNSPSSVAAARSMAPTIAPVPPAVKTANETAPAKRADRGNARRRHGVALGPLREDRRWILGDARGQRPAARRECRRGQGSAAARAARFPWRRRGCRAGGHQCQ